MGRFTVPIILTAIGFAWLLITLKVAPEIDWLWVTLIGLAGVLLLFKRPLDKHRFAGGSWLLVVAITSVLRQVDILRPDLEVPILVIALGLLTFFAQLLPLVEPGMAKLKNDKKQDDEKQSDDKNEEPAKDQP